jgi:hypothetical protein
MADGNTSVSELREIAAKAKAKAAGYKETIEEIAQHGTGLVVSGVIAGAGGFADQRFGKDQGDGVRQHYIGPAPSSLAVAGLNLGLTLLGAYGKMSHVGWSATQGAWNNYCSTAGRLAQVALAKREADKDKTKTEAPSKTKQKVAA